MMQQSFSTYQSPGTFSGNGVRTPFHTSLSPPPRGLQARIAALEGERESVLGRARKAEGQLRASVKKVAPEAPDDAAPDDPPVEGEVRFYKKVHAAPKHDILTRDTDCGCNNWESAHSADKAKKGIARLEAVDPTRAADAVKALEPGSGELGPR